MKYTHTGAPVDYERPTPIEDGLWAVFGNVVGLCLFFPCACWIVHFFLRGW